MKYCDFDLLFMNLFYIQSCWPCVQDNDTKLAPDRSPIIIFEEIPEPF